MKLSRSIACSAVGAFVVAACSSNGVTLGTDIDASLPDLDGGPFDDGSNVLIDAAAKDSGKDGASTSDGGNADSGKDSGPPAPTCTDKIQNEGETDVDCGGPNCPKCPDTKKCATGTDCTSGTCITGVCGEASCTDGVLDGTETAVDCGGTSCPPCANGLACKVGSDCTSSVCDPGALTCTPATCTDGVKNEMETAIDCGGPNCSPCADGMTCTTATDCIDGVCNVTCLAATCSDGVMNEGETDIDCGGPHCSACVDGKMCTTGTDCKDGVCNVTCQAPTCSDAVKNGTETDIDCGGSCVTKCPAGEGCVSNADCAGGNKCDVGKTNTCLAPTSTDGIQDGNETDVDCGSSGGGPGATNTNAPACGTGKMCNDAADCFVDACDYTGHCPVAPSCAPHWGGDTCGSGETGSGTEVHESCCASIPLLNNASGVSVDKYEITAGRVREFVARVGDDVYDWYQTYKAEHGGVANPTIKGAAIGIPAAEEQYLPTGLSSPTVNSFTYNYDNGMGGTTSVTGPHTFGIYDHLGNSEFFADVPSDLQGCYVADNDSYGHPTYWWDAATQSTQWGAGTRAYTQQQLDEKSLNCVTQLILAAFCAWDGGRLPTSTELYATTANSVWGASTYPWGTSPSYTDTITTTVPGRVTPVGTEGTDTGDWDVLMPLNDGTGNANLLAPTYNMANWNAFYPELPTALRYYYPPAHGVGKTTGVGTCPTDNGSNEPTNCGWGQTDEVYSIAPPGRFINDKRPDPNTGMPGTGLDGWFDVAANMMEVTSNSTATDNAAHDSLPKVPWMGGSWEGHLVARNNGGYVFNILTKYGKQGGRCAR